MCHIGIKLINFPFTTKLQYENCFDVAGFQDDKMRFAASPGSPSLYSLCRISGKSLASSFPKNGTLCFGLHSTDFVSLSMYGCWQTMFRSQKCVGNIGATSIGSALSLFTF